MHPANGLAETVSTPRTTMTIAGFLALAFGLCSQQSHAIPDGAFALQIDNPINKARTEIVEVPLSGPQAERLKGKQWQVRSTTNPSSVSPVQLVDSDNDGAPNSMVFEATVPASSSRSFSLIGGAHSPSPRANALLEAKAGGRFHEGKYVGGGAYEALAQAVMPPQHTSGSGWVRFEGPVWESEAALFRIYLDDRNTIEAFGKRNTESTLAAVTGDSDAISDWVADIMHVRNSIGLGSFAELSDGAANSVSRVRERRADIIAIGPLVAQLQLSYVRWQTSKGVFDATSGLTLVGDSRCTKQDIRVTGSGYLQVVTGMTRRPNAPEVHSGQIGKMRYWFTWGERSAQQQGFGLALISGDPDAQLINSDPRSHLLTVGSRDGRSQWWLCSGWDGEPGGIRSKQDFETRLRAEVQRLAYPLNVRLHY